MKRFLLSFGILLALAGCSKDDPATEPDTPDTPAVQEDVYTATLESPAGVEFAWSEGDCISVFKTVANEKFSYNGTSFTKADDTKKGAALEKTVAVYPYSTSTRVAASGKITVAMPSEQNYQPGKVDFASNTMVAALAEEDNSFAFSNLCGYVKVDIYGKCTVKSIELKGNNNEPLSGNVTVEFGANGVPTVTWGTLSGKTTSLKCGEGVAVGATTEDATTFYIIAPANTFSKGCSVAVTDINDNLVRKTYDKEIILKRNEVIVLEPIEVVIKDANEVIFDAQFNTDGTVTDNGIFGLTVDAMKDAEGNTPNMYTYTHPDFKDNNIVGFNPILYNNALKKHSFYKADFSTNDDFKKALADGFSMEIVTANTAWSWDWWSVPVSTDAFRFMRQGDAAGNPWTIAFNNTGWWPSNVTGISGATLEKNKYVHNILIWDANNQLIQVYHNGELKVERTEVLEFNVGSWLTIGGYCDTDGNLQMQWNGEVAKVKIYDQPLTEEEAAKCYADLTLPAAPAAPAETFGEPLLDIKWADDKSASNAGTEPGLDIISKPNDITSIINVEGFGNIVNFNQRISNDDFGDGFYRLEYGSNEAFKAKLADGFSMEVVCVSNANPGDHWVRPLSTNKWGCMLWCPPGAAEHGWRAFANAGDNNWGSHGQTANPAQGYIAYHVEQNKVMTSFIHLVYVYNAKTKEWGMYHNGNFNGGAAQDAFDVGMVLNINGMPYTDRMAAAHGWNGKIAIARIYDEAYNQEQINKRYAELQSTIEALNTTIQ